MKEIIIFGGTTEGRILCEHALKLGYGVELYVATEFGKGIITEKGFKGISINVGRLDLKEMIQALKSKASRVVIDATHPYALIAGENIERACLESGKEYIRCERERSAMDHGLDWEQIITVKTVEEACKTANMLTKGNILATTGSKEIAKYSLIENFKDRVIARVLPFEESLDLCRNAGIPEEHILAGKGPYTVEENIEAIERFNIKALITKDGGVRGGFPEKLMAVEKTGIYALVIVNENPKSGISLEKIIEKMQKGFNKI